MIRIPFSPIEMWCINQINPHAIVFAITQYNMTCKIIKFCDDMRILNACRNFWISRQ